MEQILIPNDRLTVAEHIRLFCELRNYPMEIDLDQEPLLVQQNDVYNLLVRNVVFSVQANWMMGLIGNPAVSPLPEPSGGLIVLDAFNCFLQTGGHWFPLGFRFLNQCTETGFRTCEGVFPDMETPISWDILHRFLEAFFPHRRKFALYRFPTPADNFYTYLRSLHAEFGAFASSDLKNMELTKRMKMRAGDELMRRRVLSSRGGG